MNAPELSIADPKTPTPSSALRRAQRETLARPPRPYGRLARALFLAMDVVYGNDPTLEKLVVLELVARVPYQAWENVGYVAISHTFGLPRFARRIFDYVREARDSQDNEQWHLLILEELAARRAGGGSPHTGWLVGRVVPGLLAFVYSHVSWLLYVIAPRLSYELNADFEDHAEHVYMRYVAERPGLDDEPWASEFTSDYGLYATVGDLLRRIALDERIHKLESLARIPNARFPRRAFDMTHSPNTRPIALQQPARAHTRSSHGSARLLASRSSRPSR